MAYWSKFNTSDDGIIPIGSNLFGTCSTIASTAQKTVSLSAFNVLVDGVTVHVYFEHKNEASNPTLKVGSTSASPIYCDGVQNGVWDDESVASFTYHNGRWYQNDYQQGGGGTPVTYTLTKSGSTITLNGSDGSSTSVTDSDTTYNNATQSSSGLMSASDKIKLDSIEPGATKVQIVRW